MALFYFLYALPGIVDGARKTSQVGRWAWGRGRGFSSLSMLATTVNRDQRKYNANKNLGLLNLQRSSPAFIDLASNNSSHFLKFLAPEAQLLPDSTTTTTKIKKKVIRRSGVCDTCIVEEVLIRIQFIY